MMNKQPDSILLILAKCERLIKAHKKTDHNDQAGLVDLVKQLPPKGNRDVYTLAQLKDDLNHSDDNKMLEQKRAH